MNCGRSGQDIFIKDSDRIFLLEGIWNIDPMNSDEKNMVCKQKPPLYMPNYY